ncbi:MAG: O-antigen ligase family protein, partial [bacterium]|nr:O-antigen ligase family protein [bacterium]
MNLRNAQFEVGFAWLHLCVLAALMPLFLFPKPRFWWVFLVVPVLWTVRGVVEKKWLERTPVDVPLFILLAALLATVLRVTDFSYSLSKIAGLFFGIVFFYAVVGLLKTERLLKWGFGLFLAGGFLFSLIGLLGMPTFKVKHLDFLMKIKDMIPRLDFKLPGAEAGFSTNAVGGILLLIAPLFFTLAVAAWRHKKGTGYKMLSPLVLTIGLFVTGGVLLLTQSRGAWAGLFIATVIIGLMKLRKLVKTKKVVLTIIIVLLVVGILAGIGIYSMSNSNQLKPGLKQAEGTLQFRIHLWNLTVPVIRDNPVWGAGLNNFRQLPEIRYFWSSAHNQFLHVAVELGIPALIAYLALLILMGYMCHEVRRKSQDQWLRTAALGLGWGQLAFLFFGLADAIPLGAKVGLIFWLSLALITAAYNSVHRTSNSNFGVFQHSGQGRTQGYAPSI